MRIKYIILSLGIFALFNSLTSQAQNRDSVFFTTGFKIGEVSTSSAIIWTRLCKTSKAVSVKHERKAAPFKSPLDFDNNMPVNEMDGAVEGTFGQVKIVVMSATDTIETAWEYVSEYKDFTLKRKINDLVPNKKYKLLLQARKVKGSPISEIKGAFKTAPAVDQIIPVTFTSSSCQYYWDFDTPQGYKTYQSMLALTPDFHCHTGDFVYYDKPGPMAYNVALARHKWHAQNQWPSVVNFYAQVPLYIQKDDHDMLVDDASPKIKPLGEFTFQDGVQIWREQMPIIDKPYRSIRWGKDLEIWLVEGREFRSENHTPDGPNKSIWGKEQKQWFIETVTASDATFKILMSPTAVVGPDRVKGKTDNHANASYKTEGEWLRGFLGDQKNAFLVNGDRHWQYVSKDSKTGLMEFSQGATSDSHAQGWKQDDIRPEHKFLRVKGGFLGVEVYRKKDKPQIKFTHYSVDGEIVNEVTLDAIQ